MLGDRIKILTLVPPREVCQPVYFVSRAQTVIEIQSDIINTRKGQGQAGGGIKHTQPCWADPGSTPDFQPARSARPGHTVPQPQNGGSCGSVAFTEGGEMPFSQWWFSLTH